MRRYKSNMEAEAFEARFTAAPSANIRLSHRLMSNMCVCVWGGGPVNNFTPSHKKTYHSDFRFLHVSAYKLCQRIMFRRNKKHMPHHSFRSIYEPDSSDFSLKRLSQW